MWQYCAPEQKQEIRKYAEPNACPARVIACTCCFVMTKPLSRHGVRNRENTYAAMSPAKRVVPSSAHNTDGLNHFSPHTIICHGNVLRPCVCAVTARASFLFHLAADISRANRSCRKWGIATSVFLQYLFCALSSPAGGVVVRSRAGELQSPPRASTFASHSSLLESLHGCLLARLYGISHQAPTVNVRRAVHGDI